MWASIAEPGVYTSTSPSTIISQSNLHSSPYPNRGFILGCAPPCLASCSTPPGHPSAVVGLTLPPHSSAVEPTPTSRDTATGRHEPQPRLTGRRQNLIYPSTRPGLPTIATNLASTVQDRLTPQPRARLSRYRSSNAPSRTKNYTRDRRLMTRKIKSADPDRRRGGDKASRRDPVAAASPPTPVAHPLGLGMRGGGGGGGVSAAEVRTVSSLRYRVHAHGMRRDREGPVLQSQFHRMSMRTAPEWRADVQERARYRHGMLRCSVDGTGMGSGVGGLD